MFKFDGTEAARVSISITVPGGSFTLFVQRPNANDRIVDDAYFYEMAQSNGAAHTIAYRNRFQSRLERIVDWEGVANTAGEPIPFSKQRLEQLLSKCPTALDQASSELAKIYRGDDEALGKSDVGQSGSPPVVTSQTSPLSIGTADESA